MEFEELTLSNKAHVDVYYQLHWDRCMYICFYMDEQKLLLNYT